jgi:acyl carrier protein
MTSAFSETPQILSQLQQIIVDEQIAHRGPLVLAPETRLIDEMGLDSVSMLELITAIEEKFDITINFEEFDVEVLNVAGSLAQLIENKLRAQC